MTVRATYVVQTRIPVEPAGRETTIASASELAERSREEDGTIAYHVTMELDYDPVLHFFERYVDAEALEAHTETDHYVTFVQGLPEYVAGEMETTQYEVADSWSSTFEVSDLPDVDG